MYLTMLIIGAGFVLISFLFGALADADFEGIGPIGFLQPKLIAVFLSITGILGLVLSGRFDNPFAGGMVLFISVLGGLFAAGLINRFVVIPLKNAQSTSTFDKQATIGTTARVISPIPTGGFGKIKFNVSGSLVTCPAKCEDGGEIKNGEDVAIVYIENNTYFVRKLALPIN